MTPAQEIADAINRLPDYSAYWRNVRRRLTKLSKRDAQGFWDLYLIAVNWPARCFVPEGMRQTGMD